MNLRNKSTHISYFISQITSQASKKFGFESVDIVMRWKEIVGENLAKFSMPSKTLGMNGKKVLYISVNDNYIAIEMKYISSEIKEKINMVLKKNFIDEIKIYHNPRLILRNIA